MDFAVCVGPRRLSRRRVAKAARSGEVAAQGRGRARNSQHDTDAADLVLRRYRPDYRAGVREVFRGGMDREEHLRVESEARVVAVPRRDSDFTRTRGGLART